MSQRIRVSIDVLKIAKDRLIVGQKGTYLDLILIPTPESKFGKDFMVKQYKKYAEGEDPKNEPILGDAIIMKASEGVIPF